MSTKGLIVPALAAVVTVTGCSGSKHAAAEHSAGPPPASATVAQARTAMTGVRSYAFRLTATSRQGKLSAVLLAVGRAQAPRRILATVTESGRTEQVLGTEAGQFVAAPNGKWTAVNGTSLRPINWTALLAGSAGAGTAPETLTGPLTTAQARKLGYPAQATFATGSYAATLDAAHRVTLLRVTMRGTAGGAPTEVTETVRLSGFDRQAAIPVKPAS